jgi:TonB-dependent receptor
MKCCAAIELSLFSDVSFGGEGADKQGCIAKMTKANVMLRIFLSATTACTVLAGAARAQTATNSSSELNLGSVVATGAGPSGPLAPAATGSLQQARQLEKLAPNVVTVQPQSEIEKLPDANVAEALQRAPGISLETDTGAGRFINIRGFDADLNGTTYDDIHLPASNQSSPNGGGRAVAFDTFPAGIIGGYEIEKSLTPEMDALGIGGSINLLPPSLPAGGGPLVQATVAGGEETLRHTGVYEGNIELGDSFAVPGMASLQNSKPFTVIFVASDHTDRRGINDFEEGYPTNPDGNVPIPASDFQLRYYDSQRVTTGYSGEVDFDPTSTTHFFVRGLDSGYDEQLNKKFEDLNGLDSATALGGGVYTTGSATAADKFTNSNERIGYLLGEFGGNTLVADKYTVDFRAAYVQGLDATPRSYSTTAADPNSFPITYSTANAAYRSIVTPGTNLADPNNYVSSSASNTPGRTIDDEFSIATDMSFDDSAFGGVGTAKFGLAGRFLTEGADGAEYDYNNVDPLTLGQLDAGNPDLLYYQKHYAIGPDIAYNEAFPAFGSPTENIESSVAEYQHNSENVYAAYGQQTMQFGRLELLGGLRVEVTNATYRGVSQVADVDGDGNPIEAPGAFAFFSDSGNSYTRNIFKSDYIDLFPSLQAKYQITDRLQARAAYSTAIARPGFNQINPSQSVAFNASTTNGSSIAVSEGNPNLKPQTSDSFDVTLEYYGAHNQYFAINPFYKLFHNYIVGSEADGTYEGQAAQLTTFSNIGGAYAEGIEIAGQQYLTFLPAPFDGLGASGNITYVDSSGHVDGPDIKANELFATSPISYNASLLYNKGPIGIDLATSYVSRNLDGLGGSRDADVFSSPRLRLDLDLSYQVTRQVQLFVQGHNLTNTRLEFTQSASSAYPVQREYYDQDFLVGVHYNFSGTATSNGDSNSE